MGARSHNVLQVPKDKGLRHCNTSINKANNIIDGTIAINWCNNRELGAADGHVVGVHIYILPAILNSTSAPGSTLAARDPVHISGASAPRMHVCAVQRLALPRALPSGALTMPNVGTFWRMPGVAAEAAAALMLASFSMNPALAA